MDRVEPPSGRVTIVFTDIEDSSRIAKVLGTVYGDNLRLEHDNRIRAAVEAHHGYVVKTIGDSFMLVFPQAADAVACAIRMQEAMAKPALAATDDTGRSWTVKVRMGVHQALEPLAPQRSPEFPADYHGSDVNFAARVESLGAGGQILVSDSAYQAAQAQVANQWKAWPNRRIKSFDQPETVWEYLWDGRSRGEPGARFLPTWYQGEQNRYIPRPELESRVLAEFGKLRPDGSVPRLVTLHAYGGMGKTRLAIACAMQVVGAFKDGVFFVKLDDKPRSAAAVAEAIGTALGLAQEASLPQKLPAALRDKDLLLLLDNYESVDCEEVQDFLIALLKGTGAVRLLVTGREAVKLADVEQEISLNEGFEQAEGEALFLARARLKHRDGQQWQPAMAEQEAITRIVRLSERIPVAIELAAAWVKHSEVKEIADGIEATPLGRQSGELPRSARIDQAERHRSLTRSLNYSLERLEPWAREGLARLGVFADSFTPETVKGACAVPQAEDLLFRLQEASLIYRFEVNGRSRYTMLRPTRAYAAEKFAALPEAAALRQAFIRCFQETALQRGIQASLATIPAVKVAALDWFEEEWGNLIAAAHAAFDIGDWRAVTDMAGAARHFFVPRGHWPEVGELFDLALTASQCSADRSREAEAHCDLGRIFQLQIRWGEAEQAYRKSLELTRELQDRAAEGLTLRYLGTLYMGQSQQDEAEQAFRESLAIARQFQDRQGEGDDLNNMGLIFAARGKLAEAEQAYRQSLEIYQELKNRPYEGRTLRNFGELYLRQNRLPEAEKTYRQSLAISREFKDRHGEASSLVSLGAVYIDQERWVEAEQAYQQSAAVFREFQDRHSEGVTLLGLGNIYKARGQRAEAEQAYLRSASVFRELGDRHSYGEIIHNLALVYAEQGRLAEAEQVFMEFLAIAQEFKDQRSLGRAFTGLANIYFRQNRWGEAEKSLQQALAADRGFKDRRAEALDFFNLGTVFEHQERWAEAEQVYQESFNVYREVKDRRGEGKALRGLGNAHLALRHWAEAEQAYQQDLAIKRELMDRPGEGQALYNLGVVYRSAGRWAEAEQALQASLAIRRDLQDPGALGQTLDQLGMVYNSQGRWADAEQVLQQSLALLRESKHRRGEAQALANLAQVYSSMGWQAEAEQAYRECAAVYRECQDVYNEGVMFMGLATIYQAQQRWVEAESAYLRCLEVFRQFKVAGGEGVILYNLGVIKAIRQDPQGVRKYLGEAIPILEATHNQELLESARNVLKSLGDQFNP
jgi:tetratricopeptide (TPR) repeat protein